jgi:hypothetical protein
MGAKFTCHLRTYDTPNGFTSEATPAQHLAIFNSKKQGTSLYANIAATVDAVSTQLDIPITLRFAQTSGRLLMECKVPHRPPYAHPTPLLICQDPGPHPIWKHGARLTGDGSHATQIMDTMDQANVVQSRINMLKCERVFGQTPFFAGKLDGPGLCVFKISLVTIIASKDHVMESSDAFRRPEATVSQHRQGEQLATKLCTALGARLIAAVEEPSKRIIQVHIQLPAELCD